MVVGGGFGGTGVDWDWGGALERREDRPAGFGGVGWVRRDCFGKERGEVGFGDVGLAEVEEGLSGASDEGGVEGV